ncbi:hypothetical protein CKM354_000651800 [Cercospora kikuchii]|uniref:Glycosyl transferase CAP10 domain-containing protein n=1 Tax=Cercospora kikuchii TaxID=84275 RepID=A0A9P3CIB4_9PEZI|nr:uncharacterized protein CKM354_000651800 [Cercospora kikuchii]GIZ43286.1 hypothetical protein CKM354_000651800 [Cercospora kikuchii]
MQATSLLQSRFLIVLLSVFIVLQLFLIFGNRDTLLPKWRSHSPASTQQTGVSNPIADDTYNDIETDVESAWFPSQPAHSPPVTQTWSFNSTRDARNHALSPSECSVAFPQLYHELDRSVKYWQSRDHKISPQDTNVSWTGKGGLRALIYENELRILETKDTHHYKDRHDARRVIFTLSQIHRALLGATARGETIPNIEFAIAVNDHVELPDGESDTRTAWTFDRRISSPKDERMWLMPDFNFWAWNPIHNAYQDARRRAASHDSPIEQKIPRVVWRGNRHINPELRGALLQTGKGQSWADLEGDWLDIDDFCRYLFAAYTEGHSWSGRMKYMLSCDNVAVVHELEFVTFYHHLLKAEGSEQNIVSVKRDWSDLEEKVQYYLGHPEETRRIIENSVQMFRERYLTPAAEACYWREMFRRYREVAYEPEPFETKVLERQGQKVEVKRLKGIPYELFIGTDGAEKPGTHDP